jgi:transcriptional regulator with XRE-family HTH domain
VSQDFPMNLRLLTNHYKSIAEVCRQIDINRSQFNKYLNGNSSPSRHILQAICVFFDVEEHEIMLPHHEFEESYRLKRDSNASSLAYTSYLDHLMKRSRNDLSEYDGFYFEYSYTMTFPGLILRSLMRLKTENGITSYKRLENMARHDSQGPRIKGRYRGLAFYLNDRIFQVDFDMLTGHEISQTILYPNYLNRQKWLPGLKLGVSASSVREPLCGRVLHVALGENINIREALNQCAAFDPDSPEIDSTIRAMIENKIEEGEFHFNVVTRI